VRWDPSDDLGLLVVEPAPWDVAEPLVRSPEGVAGDLDWREGDGPGAVRLSLRRGETPTPGAPLVALVALDGALPARLAALGRLWRILSGGEAPDPLTAQKRGRLKTMLRAFDARLGQASYRQIAMALYGAGRVDAEAWKTSSLRDATLRLVRDAQAMASGGYRALLR
jgi:hypothetical protein